MSLLQRASISLVIMTRYRVGSNCVIDMLVELTTLSDACISKMRENKQMELTPDDELNFIHAKTCHICNKCFNNKKNYKVRGHSHIDGKYRGAAHRKCNLDYYANRFLPVVFHNLKGYDSHVILKNAFNINKQLGNKNIDGIPMSYEKFMSLTIGDLRFIDSMQFMPGSLEKLV